MQHCCIIFIKWNQAIFKSQIQTASKCGIFGYSRQKNTPFLGKSLKNGVSLLFFDNQGSVLSS